nr:PREDICTED: uncharacterized protein LOC108951960 isoform X2 [Musa acuminata subsp. malaccensis]
MMTEKAMDKYSVSVNPNAKDGMKKHSTGAMITRGSSIPSTSKEKPLPNYLRAYTNSCHDFCKYGWKEPLKTDTKLPSVLPKLNDNLKKHSTGGMITTGSSLPSTSKKKALPHYLRTCTNSCHNFCKDGWKQAFETDTKPLSVLRKLNNNLEKHSTGGRITTGSSHPSTSKVKPLPRYLRASSNACHDFCKRGRKQVFEAERKHPSFLLKLNNKSKKLSTGGRITTGISLPSTSKKTGIIKKRTLSLWEASSSFKPKLVKQTSLKSNITHKIPVPSKITPVSAASKKVSEITTVASRSVLSPSHEPTVRRNGKEVLAKSGEKKDMLEKKMLKPSTASPSLTYIGDGVLSLNHRKHKHGKEVIPDKNQEVGKAQYDSENNEEKTLYVNKRPEKAGLDSTVQKSSKTGNVVCDSSKQPLLKCENSDMDFPLQEMLELENADTENINLHSFELNLDHQKLIEQTSVDINFPEKKLLNPENSENVIIVKPENADMGILWKNFLELENGNFDSFELDLDDQKLLEQKNADIDFLKQKLMNPENLENVDILKSGNTNMSVVGQKLLELDNINLHLFGLNPDDQEQKNVDMDFLEKNLLNPEKIENINMLKPENANMGVLGQKLLELENTNFDCFKLNPDDQKLLEQKNFDLNSLEKKFVNSDDPNNSAYIDLFKPENADMDVLGQNLLELENINLDSFELNPDNKKLFEQKNIDMDLLDDSSELKHDEDWKMVKLKNVDMSFLEQDSLMPEEIDFESLETEPTNQKLLELGKDYMDSPELKLLKPEDINLVDTLELKSDGADVNFLQEKLLKLENIDVDALELKPSDDQPSQSSTDDVEEIEESESASSETTESDSEHEINEDSDNCESLKSEQKRIVRRDAIVHHREDEFSIPHKLKFTRGKAIELQPENNGPKRLRFRRGRMVDRNVNSSHLERENFQRSEMADVVTDSKPETQSIVLKHQDTQEKDVRGLFNNVIEETTNKLVETRKSKVKALIGAFEIVISLQ